jgi:excisionase family DNA binding protein
MTTFFNGDINTMSNTIKPATRLDGRAVFTTGDIARICSVSSHAVVKWIDTGRLRGVRIPGGLARRVYRKDFLDFLDAHPDLKATVNGGSFGGPSHEHRGED